MTIARSLTNTFSGIQLADVPLFITAQLFGGFAAIALSRLLMPPKSWLDVPRVKC